MRTSVKVEIFYSFRVRKNFKDLTLGYLGTKTDRPILLRKADIHSFDFTYLPNDKTRIDTIYAFSDVSQNNLLNKKEKFLDSSTLILHLKAHIMMFSSISLTKPQI